MHNKVKFGIDALTSSFGRVVTGLITALIIPFYIPLLGKEAFGLFGIFISFELVFAVFEGGLGKVLAKDFAEDEARGEDITNKLRTFELFYLIFGIVQMFVCLAAAYFNAFSYLKLESLSTNTVNICLAIISIRGIFGSVPVVHDAVMIARSQIIPLNIFRLIFSLMTSVGALVALILSEGNPIVFFATWVGASCINSIMRLSYCWWHQKAKFFKTGPSFELLKVYKKDQAGLIMLSILMLVSMQYPIWMISFIAPVELAGLYVLSQRITLVINGSLQSLSQPMIARYVKQKVATGAGSGVLRKMSHVLTIFSILGISAYYAVSEELIKLWFSFSEKSYAPSAVASLSVILLLASILKLITIPYFTALQAERKFKHIYISLGLSCISGPILGYILFQSYGLNGLALSLSFTAIVNLLFTPLYLKTIGRKEDLKDMLRVSFASMLTGGLLYTLLMAINKLTSDHSVITLILSGTVTGLFILGSISLWVRYEKDRVRPLYKLTSS